MTNKVPNIRFKGFTDDWEQRKAGEIFKSVSDKGYIDLPVLSASQELGMILRDEIGIDIKYDESSIKNYKRVKPGQFVIHLRSFQGGFAWSDIEGITSPAYTILDYQEPEEHCSKFWKIVLTSPMFITRLETVTYGIRDGRSISFTDFSTLNLNVPSIAEQQKIGEYFSNLDHLITLHQRKCEQAKELKKFMLQKIFPKKGEKNPEIRFPGFTDDWEQRKLGEVGIAKSGVGFPDTEQGGVEGIPFFKVSDMNIKGNENELVAANNYVTVEQVSRKKWNVINDVPAIFFAKVGAAVMLNRKRLVRFPFLLDNNTMAYVFNKNVWDCDFGKTLFETLDLTKLTQVGALPSYNASDVENIRINIPNKGEQQKVGEYFSNLDHLITLHQREVFYTLKHIFYRCCDTLLSGGL